MRLLVKVLKYRKERTLGFVFSDESVWWCPFDEFHRVMELRRKERAFQRKCAREWLERFEQRLT